MLVTIWINIFRNDNWTYFWEKYDTLRARIGLSRMCVRCCHISLITTHLIPMIYTDTLLYYYYLSMHLDKISVFKEKHSHIHCTAVICLYKTPDLAPAHWAVWRTSAGSDTGAMFTQIHPCLLKYCSLSKTEISTISMIDLDTSINVICSI